MREFRTSGSVRGAASNGRPYRERCAASSWNGVFGWPQPSGGALHSAFEGLIAENNFDDAFGGFKVRF